MKSGSGFDPGVRIGPLVNDMALEKVDRQVQDAIKKGARLVTGGERLKKNGLDKGKWFGTGRFFGRYQGVPGNKVGRSVCVIPQKYSLTP